MKWGGVGRYRRGQNCFEIPLFYIIKVPEEVLLGKGVVISNIITPSIQIFNQKFPWTQIVEHLKPWLWYKNHFHMFMTKIWEIPQLVCAAIFCWKSVWTPTDPYLSHHPSFQLGPFTFCSASKHEKIVPKISRPRRLPLLL